MKIFGSLFNRRNDGLKNTLSSAIREIETHRTNLLSLKDRLETRCKGLLEKIKEDVKVYELEYSELEKVFQIVGKSELVLSQLILRLENLKDMGDAAFHLGSAVKVMKKIDKSVSELLPTIEGVFDEFDSRYNETLINSKIATPSFYHDLKNKEGEELIEEAIKYVEKKTMQEGTLKLKDDLNEVKRIAVLATAEGIDETESEFISSNYLNLDKVILNYIHKQKGNLNLIEAPALMRVSSDEVEQSILRIAHKKETGLEKESG